MLIRQLTQMTGVPPKTIRYYESIGLLPDPQRADNNYRQYGATTVERLRYIASLRSLGFGLAEIADFLASRDQGTLPCRQVLLSMDRCLADIDQRIADLVALRDTLRDIRSSGELLPPDKKCDDECLCHLGTSLAAEKENLLDRDSDFIDIDKTSG